MLPIDPILPEAIRKLEENHSLVVQATPGSGKTTRLPPALLNASFLKSDREILVLEPRRLAAKYAAVRVADQMGEEVGNTVGYHFRFENVGSRHTRLRFLTEGMLMRRLLSDPKLRNVGAVVLDEFHERHLHGDLALGFLRHLQLTDRPDLRIVVMSATLDTASVAAYLGNCPILNVEARIFPIDIRHLERPGEKYLERLVADGVRAELTGTDGDILVFLPGMREIQRAGEALNSLRDIEIHTLHGELSREAQDRAIRTSARRKVILSTNVAETSLTIEGVKSVIDCGLHRQASYSYWSGVPALSTRPISRASAIQRAGRAGRTGPGRCLRLYTKSDFDGRPAFETPEIRRADLAQTCLELSSLGIVDLFAFPWFEAPNRASLESAADLLRRLGAISDSGLTAMGNRMAGLPTHPRLARMLIEAESRGALESAATLAALVAEGKLDRLDAFEQCRAGLDDISRRSRQQLLSYFPKAAIKDGSRNDFAFSVLAGFPDRVGRKRKLDSSVNRTRAHEVEVVLSSGGSAVVEDGGVIADTEFMVALDIQEQKGTGQMRARTRLRSVCAIAPEWLFDLEPSGVEEREDLQWDAQRKAVVATAQIAYGELVLTEDRANPKPSERAGRLLVKHALDLDLGKIAFPDANQWLDAFARIADRETLESTLARIQLAAQHFPDWNIAPLSSENLTAHFLQLLAGKTTLSEIREVDWPEALLQEFCGSRAHAINQQCPTSFLFPNGRRSKIYYPLDKAPWIESRLQDFFGLAQGPSVLDRRLPLTLHLQAPNHRAVQVTSDLAGFWKRTYPDVRKELGRKYPRHFWPENPMEVEKPKPRRPRN